MSWDSTPAIRVRIMENGWMDMNICVNLCREHWPPASKSIQEIKGSRAFNSVVYLV